MALFDLNGIQQHGVPLRRVRFFEQWRRNLNDNDFRTIIAKIHEYMSDKDWFNASHIPGAFWEKTPYQAIYCASSKDWDISRFFFGLMVWLAVQEHGGDWYFKKEETDDDHIVGMTYFKSVNNT